jgi:hypothetical protein
MSEPAAAESYDLVLKGGRVLDERNGVDGVLDVAITAGKIAAVGRDLAAGARWMPSTSSGPRLPAAAPIRARRARLRRYRHRRGVGRVKLSRPKSDPAASPVGAFTAARMASVSQRWPHSSYNKER